MTIKLTGCASLRTIDLTRNWQLSTVHETEYMPGQTTQKESKLSSFSHQDFHLKRPLWERQKDSSNNTLRYGSQVGLLGLTENKQWVSMSWGIFLRDLSESEDRDLQCFQADYQNLYHLSSAKSKPKWEKGRGKGEEDEDEEKENEEKGV